MFRPGGVEGLYLLCLQRPELHDDIILSDDAFIFEYTHSFEIFCLFVAAHSSTDFMDLTGASNMVETCLSEYCQRPVLSKGWTLFYTCVLFCMFVMQHFLFSLLLVIYKWERFVLQSCPVTSYRRT